MKKILITLTTLLATTATIQAQNGEEIFKAKCAACHMLSMPKDHSNLMAPPMPKVVMKVSMVHPEKKDFVAFVSKYITAPNIADAICMKPAIKKFGLMPAIGKTMPAEEKEKVATWLFDSVKKATMDDKGCQAEMAKEKAHGSAPMKMKCAAGKCGGK